METGLSKEQACFFEKFYINKYDTANPKNGYNETLGGDGGGMYNRRHTQEAKEKISEARKVNGFSELHKKHISDSKSGVKHHMAKPVYQYSADGHFIKKWEYMNEAAITLNIRKETISYACNRSKTHKAAGFIWSYEDRGERYQDL